MAMDNLEVLNLLVIEDMEDMAQRVKALAETYGVKKIEISRSGDDAEELLRSGRFNCATIDIDLGDPQNPRRGLKILSNPVFRNIFKIMLSQHEGFRNDALISGARRFLPKDDFQKEPRRLEWALRDAALFVHQRLDIYYQSDVMARLIRKTAKAARSGVSVLILGESGSGKENMAQLIHKISGRTGPYEVINCGMLTSDEGLSRLFGIPKRGFPNVNEQPGLFELANNGTIFFDEIGEMPYEVQAQLLRILEHPEELTRRQSNEKVRISGKPVNVRCVFATNRELKAAGGFRNDLLQRISEQILAVPPLNCRRDDIPQLAWFFLDKHLNEMDPRPEEVGLDDGALQYLVHADWQNKNVRGLRNALSWALQDAVLEAEDCNSTSVVIKRKHLEAVPQKEATTNNIKITVPDGESATLDNVEAAYIKQILAKHHSNKTRTAKALGISRNNLLGKIRKYNLDDPPGDQE